MHTPASLVLEFGDGVDSSALVVPEFDPRYHPDNSFDINNDRKIYFLIHLEPGLTVEWVRATVGTVNALGTDIQPRSERCGFSFGPAVRYKDLKYLPSNQPVALFYGNTPSLQPVTSRRLAVAASDNGLPAIASVTYNVQFLAFCLNVPGGLKIRDGESDYPIEIRIMIGEAV